MSEQVLKSQQCSVLQEYPTAPTDLPAGLVGLTVMPAVLVGQQLINELVGPAGSVGPAMHFGHEWAVTGPRSLTRKGSRPSWLWQSILHGRDLLLQGVRWQPFQSKNASTQFLTSFATLAWSIWKARNRYIFDQVKISPTSVILEAQINDDVFQSAFSFSSDSPILPTTNGISHESSRKWLPPTSNLVKLNCDASFKDSHAAIGIVARNFNGSLLQCVGEKSRSESVLAAELSAIRSACILAATNGWNHAIIESDSQSAISLAATEDVPPWALAALVSDIQHWKSRMNLQLCWTSRVCNFVAHDVNFIWHDNFPCEITSIARSDAL
ncbi:F-box domain containing protein [Tanacetum coccineum]